MVKNQLEHNHMITYHYHHYHIPDPLTQTYSAKEIYQFIFHP